MYNAVEMLHLLENDLHPVVLFLTDLTFSSQIEAFGQPVNQACFETVSTNNLTIVPACNFVSVVSSHGTLFFVPHFSK